MVSRWYKIRHNIRKKRRTLRFLGVGCLFFLLCYVVTEWVEIPLCVVRNLFGVECPGCGLSRGMIAALTGDWCCAYSYHILSVPLLLGVAFFCLVHGVDIVCGTEWGEQLERKLLCPCMYVLYAVLLLLSVMSKTM